MGSKMNDTPPPAPPPPVLTGSRAQDPFSKKVGNVRFEHGADRLTLSPNRNVAGQVANALFGLFFAYRCVELASEGKIGWAIFFGLFALFDFLMIAAYFWQREDRVVHDRTANRLIGRKGIEIAALSDVERLVVAKQNGVYAISYALGSGQTVRPALASTAFGKESDAQLAAQVVARFLDVPVGTA